MLSPPGKRRRCEPPAASSSPRSRRMPGRGATLAGVPRIPPMVALSGGLKIGNIIGIRSLHIRL